MLTYTDMHVCVYIDMHTHRSMYTVCSPVKERMAGGRFTIETTAPGLLLPAPHAKAKPPSPETMSCSECQTLLSFHLPFRLLRFTFLRLFVKHKYIFFAARLTTSTHSPAGLFLGSAWYLSPNQMTCFHLKLQLPNWYKLIYACTSERSRGQPHSLPQAI